MRDVLLVLMIPLGRRWKSYSLPSTTTVCPALLPPCKERWRSSTKSNSCLSSFSCSDEAFSSARRFHHPVKHLVAAGGPSHASPPPSQTGLAFSHIKPAWECDLHSSAGGAVTAFRTQGTSKSWKERKSPTADRFQCDLWSVACHVHSNKLTCLRPL